MTYDRARRLSALADRLGLAVELTTLIHAAWVKAGKPEDRHPLWVMLIHVSP